MAFKRRRFLEIGASGILGLGLVRCGFKASIKKTLQRVDKEAFERHTGKSSYIPSLCRECPASCGVLIRVVDGKAVGIKGNPKFPSNKGGMCPKGAASLQRMLNPDRIITSGIKGSPISNTEGLKTLANNIKKSTKVPGSLIVFGNAGNGLTRVLWEQFIKSAGGISFFHSAAGVDTSLGNGLLTGVSSPVSFNIKESQFILSLGFPLLEASPAPVPMMSDVGHFRSQKEIHGEIIQIEPRFSVTAMKSDEWIPCLPNSYRIIALSIANVLVTDNLVDQASLSSKVSGYEVFTEYVKSNFSPEKVSPLCGVSPEKIKEIAHRLASHKTSIVLCGGSTGLQWSSPVETASVIALNILTGEYGRHLVPLSADPWKRPNTSEGILDLLEENRKNINAVLIINDDPVGRSPRKEKWKKILAGIPFSACVTLEKTPSSEAVNLTLPLAHPYESFHDDIISYPFGTKTWGFAKPAVTPPAGVLSIADLPFNLANALSLPPFYGDAKNYDNALTIWLSSLSSDGFNMITEPGSAETGNSAESSPPSPYALKIVVSETGALIKQIPSSESPQGKFDLAPLIIPASEKLIEDKNFPYSLYLFEQLAFMGGNGTSLPYLLEISDPLGRSIWGTFVEINPEDAGKLNLDDGEEVFVESRRGKLKAHIRIFKGIMPGVVAMRVAGPSDNRYARNLFADPFELIDEAPDTTSIPKYFKTLVKIRKI